MYVSVRNGRIGLIPDFISSRLSWVDLYIIFKFSLEIKSHTFVATCIFNDVILVLQALSENSSLTFVKPKWIFACHDKQKLVPSQPYIVAPS